MKTLPLKLLLAAATFLLVGIADATITPANKTVVDETLHPITFTASRKIIQATQITRELLRQFHYKHVEFNDALSRQILDKYLDRLDPNRSFFLAADIDAFQRYKNQLDNALMRDDLRPAFGIFNVYQTRAAERIEHARAALHGPLDFTKDETLNLDRSDQPWPDTQADADDLWRRRVKNDYLNLKLAGKKKDEIIELLDKRYAGLGRRIAELNADDAYELFMNSFTSAIEPHTSYMAPRTSENFRIAMRLSLEGIGAVLTRQNEYTAVQRVVAGGPASKQGNLGKGDLITGVGQGDDGELVNVVGWRLDDVVDLIRGPKDTVVRLEVLPADQGLSGHPEVIRIVRNKVKLEEQAAHSHQLEVKTPDGKVSLIGVVTVPTFYLDFAARARGDTDYRSTTRDVSKLIRQLVADHIDGLIIDLRNNGGGSLDEATALTGLFIDQGPVVQVRKNSGRVAVERDPSRGEIYDGPLIVMVNRFSASASEIFSAAIQDYGRGIIVGSQTYGKGTVQNLINLDRASYGSASRMGQLKITVAQFFRVNGDSTQDRGVTPDITYPALTDTAHFGESANDNALPWAHIPQARYKKVEDLNLVIHAAAKRFKKRASLNPEFRYLREDIKRIQTARKQTVVSLLESKRRDEKNRRQKASETRRSEREVSRSAAGGQACGQTPCAGVFQVTELDRDAANDPGPGSTDQSTTGDSDKDGDENKGPGDLLLLEAGRIMSDVIKIEDSQRLAQVTRQKT